MQISYNEHVVATNHVVLFYVKDTNMVPHSLSIANSISYENLIISPKFSPKTGNFLASSPGSAAFATSRGTHHKSIGYLRWRVYLDANGSTVYASIQPHTTGMCMDRMTFNDGRPAGPNGAKVAKSVNARTIGTSHKKRPIQRCGWPDIPTHVPEQLRSISAK